MEHSIEHSMEHNGLLGYVSRCWAIVLHMFGFQVGPTRIYWGQPQYLRSHHATHEGINSCSHQTLIKALAHARTTRVNVDFIRSLPFSLRLGPIGVVHVQ